jgi:hypothetical protein
MDEQDSRNFPIREHMRFQHATWVLQRIGWVLVAMVPVLGLAGVFANGILSDQVLQQPDNPLTLEFERFQRVTSLTKFTARFDGTSGEEARLRLSDAFQENYELESIQPRPARSAASSNGLELVFERPESDSTEMKIVIWARPREFGLFDLSAAIEHGAPLNFSVVVYP